VRKPVFRIGTALCLGGVLLIGSVFVTLAYLRTLFALH
jgi:hypothetical protein